MATLESARRKWEEKTAAAGEKWKAAVTGKGGEWCSGVAKFLGVGTCNPQARARYEEGVGRVSAAEFQASISGKGAKWAENLRRALSG